MEIHNYEKFWLALSLLLIVGFIATVSYGAVGVGVKMIDDSGGTVNPQNLSNHGKFANPGTYRTGPNHYDVYVIARRFMYQPGTNDPITVPANSTVTFHVSSADVVHGFEVVGTNANTMVIPGQVAKLTIEVDGPRTYGIVCNEYCGAGHHGMEGVLKVVPRDEFNATQGGN